MEFIEAKINPNSTLKNAFKKVEEMSPKSEEKNAFKKPENHEPHEIAPHPTRPSLARPCRATFLAGRPCRVLGARSVRPISARVLPHFARVLPCFLSFCSSWCSGLPPSSTLPWTYFWSPLFHRNPKISPEMKTKHNLGTIWIEGR